MEMEMGDGDGMVGWVGGCIIVDVQVSMRYMIGNQLLPYACQQHFKVKVIPENRSLKAILMQSPSIRDCYLYVLRCLLVIPVSSRLNFMFSQWPGAAAG